MTTATAPPRPPGSPPGHPPGDSCDVRTALDTLINAELTHVERDELRDLMSTAARVHGWLDSFDNDCARRARQLADAGTAEPPESLIGNATRRSGEEASRINNRANVLDEFGQPAPAASPDPGADNTRPDAGLATLGLPRTVGLTRSNGRYARGGSPPDTSTPWPTPPAGSTPTPERSSTTTSATSSPPHSSRMWPRSPDGAGHSHNGSRPPKPPPTPTNSTHPRRPTLEHRQRPPQRQRPQQRHRQNPLDADAGRCLHLRRNRRNRHLEQTS